MHRSSITLGLVLMLGCGTNAKPKVQAQPKAGASPGTSDVQHTLQLVFSIDLESVENDSRSTTVDQAVEYILTRLAYFKKTNILVRSQGEKIVVELPASPADEIRQIKNIILKRALLEFKLVDESEVNGFVRNDFMKRQYGFIVRLPCPANMCRRLPSFGTKSAPNRKCSLSLPTLARLSSVN